MAKQGRGRKFGRMLSFKFSCKNLRLELGEFPHGKHDDQCDALGLAGQLLDKVWNPQKPLPDPEAKEFDDYEIKKNDLLNNSFLTL